MIVSLNTAMADIEAYKIFKKKTLDKTVALTDNNAKLLVAIDTWLSEIDTVVKNIQERRGYRLKKALQMLQDQINMILLNGTGLSGGSLSPEDELMIEEIKNAIASVDHGVSDGLKLDVRLRHLDAEIQKAMDAESKTFIIPYKIIKSSIDELTWPLELPNHMTAVPGDIMVVGSDGYPIEYENDQFLTIVFNEDQTLTASAMYAHDVILYLPVETTISNMSSDVLYTMLSMILKRNDPFVMQMKTMQVIMDQIVDDVSAMKGLNWNEQFNIMGTYKRAIAEAITPKNLQIEVHDGQVNVSFAYADVPEVTHFVLETWDDVLNKWTAYDGISGIIEK